MSKTKTLYACATDWDHEIGETTTQLYHSVDELKERRKCWESCGIVEIKLTAKTIIKPIHPRTENFGGFEPGEYDDQEKK